jgi:hypothetical protein
LRTEAEFQQFYNDVLDAGINKTEKFRKEAKGKIFKYVIIPLFCITILDFVFPPFIIASIILLPILFLALKFAYTYNLENYRKEFGESVIAPLFAFIDTRLIYTAYKGIKFEAITISRLFEYSRDGESSNYAEGPLGETFIQFSEINLNLGYGVGDTIFKGIFLIASFNKYFHGDYFVFSGYHSNPYATFTHVKKLKLEYPDFENVFTTYGSDEIEGRYILNPSMMQRMLDFKLKVQHKVHFAFTRSRMFIAISTGRTSLFNPRLFHPVNYESLAIWFNYIQLSIGIVEEFHLNTRIWSKK